MNRSTRALAVCLTALAVSACKGNNLVVATYTKTGLHVTAVDTVPTDAVFGFKTFQGEVLPVDPESPDARASSVIAGVHISNSWLKGLKARSLIATGTAAEKAASNPKILADLSTAMPSK